MEATVNSLNLVFCSENSNIFLSHSTACRFLHKLLSSLHFLSPSIPPCSHNSSHTEHSSISSSQAKSSLKVFGKILPWGLCSHCCLSLECSSASPASISLHLVYLCPNATFWIEPLWAPSWNCSPGAAAFMPSTHTSLLYLWIMPIFFLSPAPLPTVI